MLHTFDFIKVHTALEEFGRKQLLIQRQINNFQMVFEELCVQTLMPLGGALRTWKYKKPSVQSS